MRRATGFEVGYRRRLAAVLLAVALLLSGCGQTLAPPFDATGVPRLVVTAIDVGQGDAWLIEHGTVRVLVDTGVDDAAARWLRRNGYRHLDLLVLTHPHLDHIGGAVDVLHRIRVGQMWMMRYDDDGVLAARVNDAAQQRGVPVIDPPVFHTMMLGQLQIEVLNPPPGRIYRGTNSEWNNESVVLRMVTATGTVLLLGDSEQAAHDTLMLSGIDLRADVIAVPHHGSSTMNLALFAAVNAHTAVISVGADNPYGHPHREVLAELSRRGTRIVRTDQNGTVRLVVTLTPTGIPLTHRLFRRAA